MIRISDIFTPDGGFTPDLARAQATLRFCPGFEPTPLHLLRQGGHFLLLKDERARFGLGAFKALGGLHAAAHLLLASAERALGRTLALAALEQPDVRAAVRRQTLVCASAGNHGMAVAAGARLFGATARVHLPVDTPSHFTRRLQALGAEVCHSGLTYEAACAAAVDDAARTGAILLMDFTPSGNDVAPCLVMEGYQVLGEEMKTACMQHGLWPDRVFLQAGVGSLAAAVAWHIRHHWPRQPEIVIVEPDRAPCLKLSHEAGNRPAMVATMAASIMQRLDCKLPSHAAVAILARLDVRYQTVSETEAQAAVSALKKHNIDTTPSGAAGYAALSAADCKPGACSLALITEGDGSPLPGPIATRIET